ncbi:DUF5313 domain-containing protein [Antrihabitans sp. YC2-6]|uniref:DUF5313 domain-containing protein n=1 Tax=Antrihabitans sp. YC2-6 TaxID=2799498 RepID=UPI0018F39B77|nr:DUF5313 domain-containing protein [Antrihabitans sp. YC2-6]MBJ8347914.1 DUF5313 domain-containing protein [Antrihabitans sp. YC2-6]
MSTTAAPTRPSPIQYVKYSYWAKLPDSMQDWVRHDLAGKGAGRRMIVRATIPCVLLLLPLVFIPTTWDVRASMTLPILIPFVYFSVALSKIYRRHRLEQHGLPGDLVDEREKVRDADIHRAYRERHGR